MANKRILRIFGIAAGILALLSLLIFIPQIRETIIHFGEKKIGRSLNHEVWHGRFIKLEFLFLICSLPACGFLLYLSCSDTPIFSNSTEGIFGTRAELKNIRNSKLQFYSVFIIFALLFGIRLFYISQKKSFMVDEGLSISICNRNEYGFWGRNYELDHEYSGKELKEISLWDNSSASDALSDIFHMHQDNRDSPHTNFYYSLFRLWFTGVRTSNLTYIFWRGCLLNLLFFTVSFVFMLLLLRRFTKNSFVLSALLLIAFINPASLSLTVFLRPYELQQVFVIILTYYVTCVLQADSENRTITTKKIFLLGLLVLSLTMLSAYLNMIIIGLYGLLIIILCIRKKNWMLLKFFVLMFVSSLLLSKVLYFKFGSMGYRADEAASNLDPSQIKANLIAVKNGIIGIASKNIFFEIYCVLVLFAVLYQAVYKLKDKGENTLLPVVAINFLSVVLIMYFVPIGMKTLRYAAPLFPIFALNFICGRNKKNLEKIAASSISLVLILSLVQFSGKKSIVEHLDDAGIERYKEIYETSLPIFIRGESKWRYSDLIPYLNDESRIIFVSDFEMIREKYPEKFPCIFINQTDESDFYFFHHGELSVQKLNSVGYHDVYLVGD